jgi:hypothetical protein
VDKSDTSATSSVGGLRASSKTAGVGEVRVGEYLEVLRIVEREGQWVEASITNWTVAVQEHKYGPLKGGTA